MRPSGEFPRTVFLKKTFGFYVSVILFVCFILLSIIESARIFHRWLTQYITLSTALESCDDHPLKKQLAIAKNLTEQALRARHFRNMQITVVGPENSGDGKFGLKACSSSESRLLGWLLEFRPSGFYHEVCAEVFISETKRGLESTEPPAGAMFNPPAFSAIPQPVPTPDFSDPNPEGFGMAHAAATEQRILKKKDPPPDNLPE